MFKNAARNSKYRFRRGTAEAEFKNNPLDRKMLKPLYIHNNNRVPGSSAHVVMHFNENPSSLSNWPSAAPTQKLILYFIMSYYNEAFTTQKNCHYCLWIHKQQHPSVFNYISWTPCQCSCAEIAKGSLALRCRLKGHSTCFPLLFNGRGPAVALMNLRV